MPQFWATTLLVVSVCAVTHAQRPLQVDNWPAGVTPRQELPTARAVDYDFSDVDVARIEGWLSWFGIDLPVNASGQLSGWLWAQRGTSGWLTFKDYRVEGYVSSPRLQVEGYDVEAATLRFGYASGHWYVGRLSGTAKPRDEDVIIGEARLGAKIPMDGAQSLETSGTITDVHIGPLLRSLGVDLELASDGGSLNFSGSVPLAQANNLRAWTASAALQLDALSFPGLPTADLSATAQLAQGGWSIADGTVNWLAQPVRVAGNGQLTADYPYQFSLRGAEISIPQALRTFGLLDPANQLSGSLTLEASLQGDAVQGVIAGDFAAQAPSVSYQTQQFSQIDLRGAYRPQAITLTLLQANYAGGTLEANSRWTSIEQLAQGFPNSVQLTLGGLQFDQLPGDLVPVPLQGVATGKVSLRTEPRDQQWLWSTTGDLTVRDFTAQNTAVGDVQVDWSKELTADSLQLGLTAANKSITSQLVIALEDSDQDLRHVRISGYQATGRVQQFETIVGVPASQLSRIPLQVTGKYDVQGSPARWLERGRAELALVRIAVAGEPVELQSAIVVLSPESFRLEQFRIVDARGAQLSGSSRWSNWEAITQRLPDTASVVLSGLRLDAFTDKLPSTLQALSLVGVASGELTLQSQQVDDRLEWGTQGELNVAGFSAAQTAVGDLRMQWTKELKSAEFHVELQAADEAVAAELAVLLDDTAGALQQTQWTGYRATARVNNFEAVLPIATAGSAWIPLQMTGTLELHGQPDAWLQHGTANFERVATTLANEPIELHNAVVHVTPQEFRLEKFHIFDRRGRIAGAAIVRRDGTENHRLNLRIVDASLTEYTKLLGDTALAAIDGIADLEVRLSKAASTVDWSLGWEGSLSANFNELAYREVPLGSLALTGQIAAGEVAARLEGEILNGQAKLSTHFPMAVLPLGDKQQPPLNGLQPFDFDASLVGIDLARGLALIMDPRRAALVSGVATLKASGSWTEDQQLLWDTQIRIPLMFRQGKPLARDLLLTANYADGRLQVRELSGGVGGGRVEARGSFPLILLNTQALNNFDISSGELRFDAQRIQLNALVDFLFPAYADQFSGIVSYRGAARYDRQIYLTGDAHATDAIAFGLPVQRGHGDLAVSLNLDGSLSRLVTHNLTGTAIGGRFVGNVDLRGGSRYQLSAVGRVNDGKLDQLSRALGFDHIFGTGRFDGLVRLGSRNAGSFADLDGLIQIDFDRGDAQSVPLLSDLARYVPVLNMASTDITDGRLRARIGQGILRIQDLFLNGDSFWLVGLGNASLIGGRLDIEAVLQTGGGIEQQATQQAVQRLALGLLPQAAMLIEINDLLRNRSLYFHIGGTTNQPVIQARLVRTLGKALLQNVGRSLLGTAGAVSIDSN